jgi:hypothetical protein
MRSCSAPTTWGSQARSPSLEPPEPRKRRYRLEQVPRGFRICAGEPEAELPQLLDIRAAYDVRRGNAFKKYDAADFDFKDGSFELEPPPQGVEIRSRDKNHMLLEVLEPNFRLTVVGFDANRDLCVNVQVRENENAAPV